MTSCDELVMRRSSLDEEISKERFYVGGQNVGNVAMPPAGDS